MLDGVYRSSAGAPLFHEARAPSVAELDTLLNRIIQRVLKLLTRTTGYLIEEQGMRYLAEAQADRALTPLQAAQAQSSGPSRATAQAPLARPHHPESPG